MNENIWRDMWRLFVVALIAAILLRVMFSYSTGLTFFSVFIIGLPFVALSGRYWKASTILTAAAMLLVGCMVFLPGITKSLAGNLSFGDFWTWEKTREPDNAGVAVTTGVTCETLRKEIEDELEDETDTIMTTKGLDPVDKARQVEVKRKAAAQKLVDIRDVLCKNSTASLPTSTPAPSPTPVVSSTPSTPSNPNATRVTVKSDEPWTDTGIVVASGKKYSIRVVGSDCWDNGGQHAVTQCGEGLGSFPGTIMRSAPIGELIAKTDDAFVRIGRAGSVNSRGKLLLGMNEIPGNYRDNHGTVTVEITVE